ncbi:intermediate cleaving peptidase 55, partial [Tremellales sp. Uapishka_1]
MPSPALRTLLRRTSTRLWRPCLAAYSTAVNPSTCKPPRQGQPLFPTHPHLISSKCLTPGIPAEEYESRRRKLMEGLEEGCVVVCMGGTMRLVTQQIFYKFRQGELVDSSEGEAKLTRLVHSDRLLLPHWIQRARLHVDPRYFVLHSYKTAAYSFGPRLESKPSSPRGYTYTLFVPPKDVHDAQWAGERSGVEGAVSVFGADEAHPNISLSTFLPSLLTSRPAVYVSLPPSPSTSPSSQPLQPPTPRRRSSLLKLFSSDSTASTSTSKSDPPHLILSAALASSHARPLEREVQRLRMVKSERELRLMKRAGDMSSDAHAKVMRFAEAGVSEGALAAHFEYHCALAGSERPAYVPVVASGANSLIIHYTNNDCLLEKDDLVLIDAGGELSMYASDITRTFPVSGRFSDPQRDLYQAVLNAQKECVKRCTVEGGVTMNELHRTSCSLLTEELRQIGFKLSIGDVERKLYPHFLSHHLGSDLHDCPSTDRNAVLVEGNVITIEPGIYVPFDSAFPKHFHGLGIRIEDEIAFQKDGPYNLSANAPKEIVDVEAACQGSLG